MNIAPKITDIIEKRRKQAEHVATVIENWKNLRYKLNKINERKDELKEGSKDNHRLISRLDNIDFSIFVNQINQQLEELENLKSRLSRSTLNIGVVGGMRQGKSRLLQTLTGLDNNEIPTGNEGVCTRVLSKIFHANNSQKATSLVKFHSSESLREIIHLYFDKLSLPGSKPIIPDDLESEKFPPNLPVEKQGDTDARYQYGILRKNYYVNYKKYKSLINSSPRQIQKKDIKKFITQVDGNESEYIAVKELEISCEFPYKELGDIGVIDLPGLGDTIIDTELLIKTLKQDVDFILFVRKPNPDGDDWKDSDRNMYQIARHALTGFPISQCSFMILNKKNNEQETNLRVCQYLEKNIHSHEIKVSKTVIADCSNYDEVKNFILLPVLENLTQNINFVFEQYLESQNQNLAKLWDEISNKMQEASNALEGYSQQGELGFHDWFEEKLWKPLNGKILQERKRLFNEVDKPHEQFKTKVDEVLESCRKDDITNPLSQKIEGFRNSHDSYKIAYYLCINELKDELTKKIKSLADALVESERKLQLSVVNILSEEGKFKELTKQKGIDFFDEIEKQFPANTSKLREAFREIKKSTDTYEDEVIRWIQIPLNELNPDKHLDPISENYLKNKSVISEPASKPKISVSNGKHNDTSQLENITSNSTNDVFSRTGTLQAHPTNSSEGDKEELVWEEIHKKIDFLRNQVVDECKIQLDSKLTFPNQEAFTKFDKFFVLGFKGELGGRAWRYFCEEPKTKSKLWDGAKKNEENQKVEEEWKKLVDNTIITANEKDSLLLLKN